MRAYQKQYGGRFVRHLVHHWVEESWYRELSQIMPFCAYVCPYAYAYALVKTRLKGAFLWDDLDQVQWSEITDRIMVDQMNRWIHSGQGFIGSFDLLWSGWSRITDPDPDHPRGKHPKFRLAETQAIEVVPVSWLFLACVAGVEREGKGSFRREQERIKGTEKATPYTPYSIGNSPRVIFKTADPKGD